MASKTFSANYDGTWDSSNYVKLYLDVETTSKSITNNTTTENCKLYTEVQYAGGSYNSSSTATIEVDDGSTSQTVFFDFRTAGTKTLIASWNKVVKHEDDGTATVDVKATHVSGVSIGTATITGTYTCDVVERTTEISNVSGNIGSSTSATVNVKNSNFSHVLSYVFGDLSGTLSTTLSSDSKSLSFTIPTTFYAQIPDDPSGTGTLTLKTYSGNTLIGSDTATLTAIANESTCKPTINNLSMVDTNSATIALTGSENKIVKGYSTAYVNGTATAKNSASLEKITVGGVSATAQSNFSKTISSATSSSYEIAVTDSRGYPATGTASASDGLVDYFNMTMQAEVSRPSQTGNQMQLLFSGNIFNASFGSVTNAGNISWKVREGTSGSYTTGATLVENTDFTVSSNTYYSGTGTSKSAIGLTNPLSTDGTWDYQKIYTIVVTHSDKLSSGTSTIVVVKGIPVWNVYEDSDGINHFNVNGIINTENLVFPSYQYWSANNYAINLNNSDVIGANRIFFRDTSGANEGVCFLKSSGTAGSQTDDDYDILRVLDGIMYLSSTQYSPYRVGDVLITSSNTNPSGDFGGTWNLIDKGYIRQTITKTYSSDNADLTVVGCFDSSGIRMRILVTPLVDLSDSTVTLGTVSLSDFGMNSSDYGIGVSGIIGASDSGNTIIACTFGNTGILSSVDTYDSTLSAGSSFYLNFYLNVPSVTNISDSFCNKFYWEKTA